MRDELCLQRRMDKHWANLLATMAPACVGSDRALARIDTLIGSAITRFFGAPGECPDTEAEFPPTVPRIACGSSMTSDDYRALTRCSPESELIGA